MQNITQGIASMETEGVRAVHACRVCGNPILHPVLDLGVMALTGRFPAPDEAAPPAWPVTLVRCDTDADPRACGTAQLLHDYDQTAFFGPFYGYRSGVTETMRNHLARKAADLARRTGLGANEVVIDIGANDGTLLKAYSFDGLSRIGVDPSAAPFAAEYPADARLIVDFFPCPSLGPALAGRKAKIVTSVAMFYDVPDPVGFARAVKDVLAPDGIWEIEIAYFPRIIEILGYDTTVHEHVMYYGLTQLDWIARAAGMRIVHAEENTINGASIRVLLTHDTIDAAPPPDATVSALLAYEASLGWTTRRPYESFAMRVFASRDVLLGLFNHWRIEGRRVLGYGASTKGNTVLQYCGIGRGDVPAILERYPKKFGLTTPGTGIPILPEEEGKAMKPDVLFVLPWQFRAEIEKREAAWVAAGGTLLFAFPTVELITRDGVVKVGPPANGPA
jgi:NDP-4-keto-2,6-dideoxyhexose 3-C-methyltransferase